MFNRGFNQIWDGGTLVRENQNKPTKNTNVETYPKDNQKSSNLLIPHPHFIFWDPSLTKIKYYLQPSEPFSFFLFSYTFPKFNIAPEKLHSQQEE